MYPDVIFTLEARGNVFLETMKSAFNLSSQDIYKEIRWLFEALIDNLKRKNINYEHLKNALVPRADRKEIALVFDTTQIETAVYGSDVFLRILPLLERKATFSCLCGDYIGSNKNQIFLRDLFLKK